jgi:hypothetical protein
MVSRKNSKNIVIAQLVLHCALAFTVIGLSGCSHNEPQAQTAPPPPNPVLEIKHTPYTFSMYPQFQAEGLSLLKLAIHDSNDNFVHGASVSAHLLANDGDRQHVTFTEDNKLEVYAVEIPLKHHEDYVIDTHIDLKDKGRFTPKFSFHCGDPIPGLPTEDTSEKREKGSSK